MKDGRDERMQYDGVGGEHEDGLDGHVSGDGRELKKSGGQDGGMV